MKIISIFLRATLMILLYTSSIWFIFNNYYNYAILSGAGISLLWTLNVKDISIGNWYERVGYVLGGVLGSTISLYLLPNMLK